MLSPQWLDRFARILWWGLRTARRARFRSGDLVLLRFDAAALPLAERVYGVLAGERLKPVIQLLETPSMESAFYGKLADRVIGSLTPGLRELTGAMHGLIHISAPGSLTHLRAIPPGRLGLAARSKKPLMDLRRRREEAGHLGWTLCTFPTAALAERADMSLASYTRTVARACLLEAADPVAAWEKVYREVQSVKQWLHGLPIVKLRVESKGTDLLVALGERRQWLGVSGRNIPSFEIFTSPDWRGTRGVYWADQPSYRSGNLVQGVRLEFADGKAVRASALRGEKFLKKMIALDGNACKLGEFSLTDRRFSRIDRFMADTLYDENYGGRYGNCHVALGSAYTTAFDGDPSKLSAGRRTALGFNDSALHWDLVNTEKKRVTAELKGGGALLIYENGEFKGP